jgi:hypothetical protein
MTCHGKVQLLIASLLLVFPQPFYAQLGGAPIEMTALRAALRDRRISSERLLTEIQQRGVAFTLDPDLEIEFRDLGWRRGKKALDNLIRAIRSHAPKTDVSGLLVPANDPYLQDECSAKISLGALRIYLGNSTISTTSGSSPFPAPNSPYPVILSGNERLPRPILTIEKSNEGYLYLTADIRGADGRFIAKIERNKFLRNPHTTWYQKTPDRSSLAIYDDMNEEVLYVRYMNPTAIRVRGRFNYPGRLTMVITDKAIVFPDLDQRIQALCSVGALGGIRF